MRLLGRQAAVALTAALFATAASAEVWQWTDAEGVVRYTPNPQRVPESQRGSLIKLEPGMKVPAPSPSGPPAMYAPPEELPFGADPFDAPEPARTLEAPEAEPSAVPEPARALEVPEAEPSTTPEPARALEVPEVEASAAPEPARAPEVPETLEAKASSARAPRAPSGEEPEPLRAPRPLSDAERARRAQLEEQIAADQEALKALISRGATEGDDPLRESPELREIARRLPALQAELRALDEAPEQRAEQTAPEP
jgi:hypothetical protein